MSDGNAPSGGQGDVTRLLASMSTGDDQARVALFDALYAELRRLASSAMRSERGDHTLQPTALVHEAYVRLVGSAGPFENRSHFLAVAATAMRRVLIDHARARRTEKRGGQQHRIGVEDVDALAHHASGAQVDILAVDSALTRLHALDPRQGQIVELRFFGGLSVEEAAAVVGVSERTVKREWQIARAWLRREIGPGGRAEDGPDH